MRLLTRRKTPTEELKDAAIEALVNALDDDKRAAKPGTKGVRALAAGAVIYTAGRAAFKGQRFVREQLSSDTEDDQAEDLEDAEETRAYEEPEAEGYEVDEEEDEPEAVEEDEDEPDEDEDTGDDESDEGDRGPSGVEREEPQGDEDSEEPEARWEPDDEASSKTSTPSPERKPTLRAARKKGAQPSLKLPKQRRARTRVSKD
jgi:hypothetical protein